MSPQRAGDDIAQALIDAEAVALRARRYTFRQIAAEMGCDVHTAHDRVKRAIALVPSESVKEIRALELEELDEMARVAREQLHMDHLKVDHGRIVTMDDGTPIIDHGGKLAGLDRLLKIQEGRRRLIPGLEAPRQTSVTVVTEDDIDARIAELEAQGYGDVGEGGRPAGEAAEAEGTSAAANSAGDPGVIPD